MRCLKASLEGTHAPSCTRILKHERTVISFTYCVCAESQNAQGASDSAEPRKAFPEMSLSYHNAQLGLPLPWSQWWHSAEICSGRFLGGLSPCCMHAPAAHYLHYQCVQPPPSMYAERSRTTRCKCSLLNLRFPGNSSRGCDPPSILVGGSNVSKSCFSNLYE